MPRSSRWAKHRQMMGDHLWGAETCAALGKADPTPGFRVAEPGPSAPRFRGLRDMAATRLSGGRSGWADTSCVLARQAPPMLGGGSEREAGLVVAPRPS
jgi:hypothetical protein